MEEDKKKRRNKKNKNKNKQSKSTEEDDAAAPPPPPHAHAADQNPVGNGLGDQYRVSHVPAIQNGELKNAPVDASSDVCQPNGGPETSSLAGPEKQEWLRKEAALELTIKQLHTENDSHMKKEAMLEETIKQLQDENELYLRKNEVLEVAIKELRDVNASWIQKEATFEEMIKQLKVENDLHMQKQATLEETIKQLQKENDSYMQKQATFEETIKQLKDKDDLHMQKQATFEETIKQLKNENDSHTQKQAGLELKVQELLGEKNLWLQKEASLGEKVKQIESEKNTLVLTESISKETIVGMNVDIARLRMQVVELEESRNCLLKENQQLRESILDLSLQIKNLEATISSAKTSDEQGKYASEREDLNSQIEAAHALVDKLITENSELIEKVNELYVKIDQQDAAVWFSPAVENGFPVGSAQNAGIANPPAESGEDKSTLGHKLESIEVEPASAISYSSEADSGEIVQIPLDDNEVVDLEQQVVESEKNAVPLSDAPLIGAPFRLISFVAKYVSGADLVNTNTGNSGL